MINAIDNGILTTDLDADGHNILNIGSLTPPPPNLVASDDPRLSDARAPLDGSVTNDSVYSDALIDQSKLNLDGDIPSNWIGVSGADAAAASLAEYIVNKNVPGGYPGLDATGRVSVLQLPEDFGTGTITSVDVAVPPELTVSGNPVTSSGTITIGWATAANDTWFGNMSGVSAVPQFNSDPIPPALVPNLPASKITSGTINPARLPTAVGVGGSASAGAVPDPGATGDITDYLARDMTYKPVPTIGPSYQPMVTDPVLTVISATTPTVISVSCAIPKVSLFYKLNIASPTYSPVTSGIVVESGDTLSVYGAKAGYTNSNIITYSAP